MRVMPSVTETIEPMLRASVTGLKFSIRCLMSSEISVALMAIVLVPCETFLLRSQLVGDALEARAECAVDLKVPGCQRCASGEFGKNLAVHVTRELASVLP